MADSTPSLAYFMCCDNIFGVTIQLFIDTGIKIHGEPALKFHSGSQEGG